MKMFVLVAIIFLLLHESTFGFPCNNPLFTRAEEVSIRSDHTLLVTHASFIYDRARAARTGIDHQIELAKNNGNTVIYLQHQLPGGLNNTYVNSTYYASRCDPTYNVISNGGEFSFSMPSSHVSVVGGFWEMCQASTLKSLFTNWSLRSEKDLVLTQVMDSIYTVGGYILSSDSYYQKFRHAFDVEQLKPPFEGGTWTLSQIMDLIGDSKLEVEFLKRNLPPYQILGPEVQVDLFYKGFFIETLQKPKQAMKYLRIEYL
jgi:hypothetical protein